MVRRAARLLSLNALARQPRRTITFLLVLLAMLAAPSVTRAQVNGTATGVQGTVTQLLGGGLTVNPTPHVTLPGDGSTAQASILDIGAAVPVLGDLIDTDTVTVRTTAVLDRFGNAIPAKTGIYSSSHVENLKIGGLVPLLQPTILQATGLTASCYQGPTGLVGGFGFDSLTVLGNTIAVPLPNTLTINLPLLGSVAVNRQVTTTTATTSTLTVTALHLDLLSVAGIIGGTNLDLFQASCTVDIPPTATGSLSPNVGPTTGGTLVTINGTNFLQGASVSFGGTPGTSVNVVSPTQLTVVSPAHAAGVVDVTVTTAGGTTSPLPFTYVPGPSLTSLTPTAGPVSGGTLVTITGSNFVAPATVSFGGSAGTSVTVVNATTITAISPAHVAGAVNVTVTTPGGTSGPLTFTYLDGPTLTSLSPTSGPVAGGTLVTITGSNFAAPASVSFGGTAGTSVTVVNATTITAISPAHIAGAVNVTVTTPGGTSGPQTFTYLDGPTLTSLTPTSGPAAGGTLVTITGTNFAAPASVSFGGTAGTSVTVVNATTITAVSPAHVAGAVNVTVTTPGGTSGPLTFTYLDGPTLTSLTPTSGPVTGGTLVTITGANFAAPASVSFGGAAGTSVTVVNATTITAVSPAHIAGAVNVTVTTPGGTSGPLTFTYLDAPAITSLSPTSGPVTGGTLVTITGTNFAAPASVSFGGTAGTSVTVVDATTITAVSPAHIAGAVDVTVTTPGGTSGPLTFTYLDAPTLTSLTPTSGPVTGGTLVTITGANFAAPASVSFGGAAGTSVTVVDATTITAVSPAHIAGAVDVIVTTPGGNSGPLAFTYLDAPTLTSLTPTSGPVTGGTLVTITGANFAAPASVSFGGAAGTSVTVVNATTLTVLSPAHVAGAVDVIVSTAGGNSGPLAFTYLDAPTTTSLSPTSGPVTGGTLVTITGANFAAPASVSFGGAAGTSVTVVNATTITAVSPAHAAGAVDVIVTTPGGNSGPLAFTYLDGPTLTSLSPTSGPVVGGTLVTITGANFAAPASVSFGGTAGTSVTVVNATTITAVSPAHAAGTINVTVTTPGGTSGPLAFTYLDAPAITTLSPTSGPIAGGTLVTITGTNFAAPASVSFGGTPGTSVTVVNATTITALSPAHAAGAVDVTVTTLGGTSGPLAFTYYDIPTITTLTPTKGPQAGGNVVTITGTNFGSTIADVTVTFGATNATVTNVTPTQITVTAPAAAAPGSVDVTVTTPGGTSGPLPYEYVGIPTLTAITPNAGPVAGGNSVTLTGTNFGSLIADVTVAFGASNGTVTAVTPTSITVTVPAAAGPGVVNVTVTTPGGTTTPPLPYTYATQPILTSLTPDSGPVAGGTNVTIAGQNFAAGATVSFGGTPGTNVNVVNATLLTVTSPAHVAGLVNVTVTTAGGTSAPLGFTYVDPPTSTSLTPNSGPVAGGQVVVVNGTGFGNSIAGVTVTFGANAATVTSVTPAAITVTTPAAAAPSAVSVVVTTAAGATAPLSYTYIQGPTLTAIDPNEGPQTGGNTVTITGTNFGTDPQAVTVTFGGQAATVTTVNGSILTAIVPAAAAPGTVNVTVSNTSGTSGTLPYRYIAVPTLTNITPASGPVAGGNNVILTGTNFGTNLADVVVRFGVLQGTVTSVSPTSVAVNPPAAGGPSVVNVTVTTPGGTTGPLAYAYVVGPAITSITPNKGPTTGGTAVTIVGSNFASPATVTFAGNAATSVVVVNATTITAVTPAGALGAAAVTVTSPGGSSAGAFTYVSVPSIGTIVPPTGTDGDIVTINGSGFQQSATVTICGSTVGVTFVSATQVRFVAPVCPAGGPQDVTLTNPDGGAATAPDGFTYLDDTDDDPTITSVVPAEGPPAGGTNVTIKGNDFIAGATVTFGGLAATNVVVVNGTTITATTPAHPVGVVTVVVTTSGGTGSLPGGFTYRNTLPPPCPETFGLDPNDVNGDPDGDGLTNLQECTNPDPTHPKGFFTRYLAEGASNSFFDVRLALFNPNPASAVVLLQFQRPGGGVYTHVVKMQPNQRLTLRPASLPNFTFSDFSTTIESDLQVVTDRLMIWSSSPTNSGSHAETAVPARSTTWYLAEGSTSGPFSLFYLLQNPQPEPALVTVRYLLPFGQPPIVKAYELPPVSRTTLFVDNEGPELVQTDVSAVIESNQQIVVERAMYLDQPGASFLAGHGSAGVTAPATEWFLAEGATGSFFELFLLLANPNPTPAQVEVAYLLLNGSPIKKTYTVPGNGRFTIWVDEEQFPEGSGVKSLATAAVSMRVRSLNNVSIIAERSMWWPQPVWHEGHNATGVTSSGTRWAVAEGEVGGDEGHETYILVANVSDFAGTVNVTLAFEDGTSAVRSYPVPATSRINVQMSTDFPQAAGKRFATLIESVGQTPAQIVIERSQYSSPGGVTWSTGAAAIGTKLQ